MVSQTKKQEEIEDEEEEAEQEIKNQKPIEIPQQPVSHDSVGDIEVGDDS